MATTLNDIQLRVAYRLGESAAPSGVEASRRLQSINEGYKAVIRKHFWWFTEAEDTFNSVANQTYYTPGSDGFPTDIRGSLILELRVDGQLITPLTQTEAMSCLTQGYSNYSQSYFIFNKKLYPVQPFTTTGTDNCSIKYYKVPTMLSSGTDEVIIPDEYADILVAYCVARKSQVKSKRGTAADAFDEFNEILREMQVAQNEYMFSLKSYELRDYDALYE